LTGTGVRAVHLSLRRDTRSDEGGVASGRNEPFV
jgi:hypothetical protein